MFLTSEPQGSEYFVAKEEKCSKKAFLVRKGTLNKECIRKFFQ